MKTGVFGNKDTTGLVLNYFIKDNWPLNNLVCISPSSKLSNSISGYHNPEHWKLPKKVEVIFTNSYSLNHENDKKLILSLKLDLIFVIGWQRLIPEWLLNSLKVGAFGMHGSSEPLPSGRGRSPLNWSIIQGKKQFQTNLFKYEAGIDDGNIVGSDIFEINKHDTGGSLQMKNTFSMIKLLKSYKNELLTNSFSTIEQPSNITPTYYPKRRAVDGQILWGLSSNEIDRLVRAVSFPFPGAKTFINDVEIIVWEGYSIAIGEFDKTSIGEVVYIDSNKNIILRCGDGFYCITNYQSEKENIKVGDILKSKSDYCWDPEKLPITSSKYCSTYEDIPEEYRKYV